MWCRNDRRIGVSTGSLRATYFGALRRAVGDPDDLDGLALFAPSWTDSILRDPATRSEPAATWSVTHRWFDRLALR